MTNATHDPRQLEPDWVGDFEAPEIINWKIIRRKWNKKTKKYDQTFVNSEGDPAELFNAIEVILGSSDPECSIQIDASLIKESSERRNWCDCKSYVFDKRELEWDIEPAPAAIENCGTDLYEMVGNIEWLIDKGYNFMLTINYGDPTPLYSEIGSMF